MSDKREKSGTYGRIGTALGGSDGVPTRYEGIGTRISAVAELLGSRKNAAQIMGVSADSLQRYLREENTPPFDVAARLCLAAKVRMEWLATGEGDMHREAAPEQGSQQARLNPGMLRAAVEVLDRVLEDVEATTDAAGRAELVVAIYELLEQGSALDAAQRVVASMLRAASRATGATVKQG